MGWISDLPLSAFTGTLLGIDVLNWLGDCPLTYFSQRDPSGLAWIRSSPADVAKPRGGDCNLPARSTCWELPAWEGEQEADAKCVLSDSGFAEVNLTPLQRICVSSSAGHLAVIWLKASHFNSRLESLHCCSLLQGLIRGST